MCRLEVDSCQTCLKREIFHLICKLLPWYLSQDSKDFSNNSPYIQSNANSAIILKSPGTLLVLLCLTVPWVRFGTWSQSQIFSDRHCG